MNHWKPAIVVVLAALVAAMLIAKSRAHDAPSGWAYSLACCSNRDCHEIEQGGIKERPEGYTLVVTGEIVPYGDKRIKDSPDGLFHACQQGGDFDSGRIICLYVPPRGF